MVRGGCRTPGCRGTGHIEGPKFSTHQTTATCPYARENLDNESNFPDRLQGSEQANEIPIRLDFMFFFFEDIRGLSYTCMKPPPPHPFYPFKEYVLFHFEPDR